MKNHRRAVTLRQLIGLLFSSSAPLAAQQLRGQVLLPDTTSRASGIVVVATDARGGVTRTLSGLNGDFLLRLPHAGRFSVQALRIGYRPSVLPAVMVADGETSSVRIVLDDTPVLLAAVMVRGNNVCRISLDSGQAVAKIWQEARTAIAATQLAASGEPLVARWIVFDSLGDRTATSMHSGRVTLFEGATTSVFESVSADSLERFGYVTEKLGQLSFYAPDANVLLSDSFAGEHCFHSEPPPDEHADWIGVAFQPAADRPGYTDVEGTLWLDRKSAELRLLEFRYARLPAGLGIVQPRGMVEFLRLSSGNWIINRWSIRIPRAVKIEATRRVAALYAPTAIQLKGGAVTEVRHLGVVVFRAKPPVGRILGVFDDATGLPIAGADVIDTDAETKAVTSASGTVQLSFLGADSAAVLVRRIGYYARTLTVATGAADTVPITVTLKPIAQELPTVVSKGSAQRVGKLAEFERRRAAGFGKFITSDILEKNANRQTGDIMNLLAGARIVRPTPTVAYIATTRGGSGPCYSTVIVDGVVVFTRPPQPRFNVNTIPPEQIAGIEFYAGPSTTPVEYNATGNACGAVVIWTK
jgi:hypothetical protein